LTFLIDNVPLTWLQELHFYKVLTWKFTVKIPSDHPWIRNQGDFQSKDDRTACRERGLSL